MLDAAGFLLSTLGLIYDMFKILAILKSRLPLNVSYYVAFWTSCFWVRSNDYWKDRADYSEIAS